MPSSGASPNKGGGGGGGSVGRMGGAILSLNDCDTPIRPSFPPLAPGPEKEVRASLREGRDISLSLVVSWNMCGWGREC